MFHVKRIAVIGAGPAGLVAAKYLEAQHAFDCIDVFEQGAEVGGVWNYSPIAAAADGPPIPAPQTDAHCPAETPLYRPSAAGIGEDGRPAPPIFPSPMYEDLHTNIPKSVMAFSDLPLPDDCLVFPSRQTVQEYLVRYAADVRHLIRFSTQVTDVRLVPGSAQQRNGGGGGSGDDVRAGANSRDQWAVTTSPLLSPSPPPPPPGTEKTAATATTTTTQIYDAVVVASGHYAVPYIPDVPGLRETAAAAAANNNNKTNNPDSLGLVVTHAKRYRSAVSDPRFRGRKVLVVGNAASGLDIAAQIGRVCRKPLLVSARTATSEAAREHAGGFDECGEIDEFLLPGRPTTTHTGGSSTSSSSSSSGETAAAAAAAAAAKAPQTTTTVRFRDGRVEEGIETVLFATGYLYTFPFLERVWDGCEAEQDERPGPLVTDGRRVHGVARQLLHVRHPTLVFPGLPMKVTPFPLVEGQAAVFARLWANALPQEGEQEDGDGEKRDANIITPEQLEAWERDEEEACRQAGRGFHVFPPGGDGEYINEMYRWAMGRERPPPSPGSRDARGRLVGEERQNGTTTSPPPPPTTTIGKEPPYWDEEAMWTRGIMPRAKMKFESTGRKAKTLEELGFGYPPA